MNKTERKSTLKGIIKDLKSYKNEMVDNAHDLIDGQIEVDNLYNFLDDRCILPSDWDFEDMKSQMIREFYENDDVLSGIVGSIDEFSEEVYETMEDMKDGSRKDEWSEFYDVIEDAKATIELSEVTEVEELEEQISDVINILEDLI